MRTLEDYIKVIEVTFKSDGFEVFAEVIVRYNRHRYKFTSGNWRACNRIGKRDCVHDKVQLYGYSLKGAYEAFYKEFAKLHKANSDKLSAIIC